MEETVTVSVDNLKIIIDKAEGLHVPEILFRSALNGLYVNSARTEVEGQLPLW